MKKVFERTEQPSPQTKMEMFTGGNDDYTYVLPDYWAVYQNTILNDILRTNPTWNCPISEQITIERSLRRNIYEKLESTWVGEATV